MHEEIRTGNGHSINNKKLNLLGSKESPVNCSQECSCYNTENSSYLLEFPQSSSLNSVISFSISPSSSSTVLPNGNIVQPHGQLYNNGTFEYYKKSCCIPSNSIQISSLSNNKPCNFSLGSFQGTSKHELSRKKSNGVINSGQNNHEPISGEVINSVKTNGTVFNTCSNESRNGEPQINKDSLNSNSVHLREQTANLTRNMNLEAFNNGSKKYNATYEYENTQTCGSINVLNVNDLENTKTSTATSNITSSSVSKIGSSSSIVPINKPLYNLSIASPKNYSLVYKRLYDRLGPVMFPVAPLKGIKHPRGELKLWPTTHDQVISQNSSKRKVHRSLWIPSQLDSKFEIDSNSTVSAYPMALKFVEDGNTRDGRSIKREIECHLYIYQRLSQLQQIQGYDHLEDAWPCAELIGYYLDKKNPGNSVLVTRKLSGPDFFDIIRSEHSSSANAVYNRCQALYEYNKLQWCTLALTRIAQYSALGIRHNDIKPDNIVLDFYYQDESNERHLDVKIIDLGTASMHSAKDFTGGTSWYESPEQKMLEYYTKKNRDIKSAKTVDIGLSSDSWGAGISIAEVLMGRRVVDSMKTPYGPGPLEFRGKDGWLIDPQEWVEFAKIALGFDNKNTPPYKYKICEEAAKYIFNMLVQVNSSKRANISDVIKRMDYFTQRAYQEVKLRHKIG
ncbi:Ser Thr kinase [Cryptosporidium xiaoi]|uniref:Ser Thr kinase n=1 Tax=Cryptosporidium xiaoi TaxID=659607 RepID=A0AAV9XXN2_9CRYT